VAEGGEEGEGAFFGAGEGASGGDGGGEAAFVAGEKGVAGGGFVGARGREVGAEGEAFDAQLLLQGAGKGALGGVGGE
jgi:hypothetical protein